MLKCMLLLLSALNLIFRIKTSLASDHTATASGSVGESSVAARLCQLDQAEVRGEKNK